MPAPRPSIICIPPQQAVLVMNARKGIESQGSALRIENTSDVPITLFPPVLNKGGNIQVRFSMDKRVTLKAGESLDLKTFVTPLSASSVYGSVSIKTMSTSVPMIEITINGTMAPTDPPS